MKIYKWRPSFRILLSRHRCVELLCNTLDVPDDSWQEVLVFESGLHLVFVNPEAQLGVFGAWGGAFADGKEPSGLQHGTEWRHLANQVNQVWSLTQFYHEGFSHQGGSGFLRKALIFRNISRMWPKLEKNQPLRRQEPQLATIKSPK